MVFKSKATNEYSVPVTTKLLHFKENSNYLVCVLGSNVQQNSPLFPLFSESTPNCTVAFQWPLRTTPADFIESLSCFYFSKLTIWIDICYRMR